MYLLTDKHTHTSFKCFCFYYNHIAHLYIHIHIYTDTHVHATLTWTIASIHIYSRINHRLFKYANTGYSIWINVLNDAAPLGLWPCAAGWRWSGTLTTGTVQTWGEEGVFSPPAVRRTDPGPVRETPDHPHTPLLLYVQCGQKLIFKKLFFTLRNSASLQSHFIMWSYACLWRRESALQTARVAFQRRLLKRDTRSMKGLKESAL